MNGRRRNTLCDSDLQARPLGHKIVQAEPRMGLRLL